jgi:hypothetical protein
VAHHIVHHIYGPTPGVVHMECDQVPVGLESLSGPHDSPEAAWEYYWRNIHPQEQFSGIHYAISKAARSEKD